MGVSKKIKMALIDKGITQKELAERLGYQRTNSVYNMLNRDNMTYAVVERWADAIGCEIVLRDKENGKIYR